MDVAVALARPWLSGRDEEAERLIEVFSGRGVRQVEGPGDELKAIRITMLSVWITPLQRDTLILNRIPRNTLKFILHTAYVISTKLDHFWPRADEILYKSVQSNVPSSSIIQYCAFPNRLRWMHWDAA